MPSDLVSSASPSNGSLKEVLGNGIKEKGAGKGDFMGVSEAPGEKPIWSRLGTVLRRGSYPWKGSQTFQSPHEDDRLSIMEAKATCFSIVSLPMDRPL